MPQLDIASYFSQFFWLFLVFGGFYIIVVKDYLPALTRLGILRRVFSSSLANTIAEQSRSLLVARQTRIASSVGWVEATRTLGARMYARQAARIQHTSWTVTEKFASSAIQSNYETQRERLETAHRWSLASASVNSQITPHVYTNFILRISNSVDDEETKSKATKSRKAL